MSSHLGEGHYAGSLRSGVPFDWTQVTLEAQDEIVHRTQDGGRRGLTNATCVLRLYLFLRSVALGSHQWGGMQRSC